MAAAPSPAEPPPRPLDARALELHRELMENADPALRARVHLELGTICLREGRLEAAVRHFREALTLDPRLDAARRRLAELGRHESAVPPRVRSFLSRLGRRTT